MILVVVGAHAPKRMLDFLKTRCGATLHKRKCLNLNKITRHPDCSLDLAVSALGRLTLWTRRPDKQRRFKVLMDQHLLQQHQRDTCSLGSDAEFWCNCKVFSHLNSLVYTVDYRRQQAASTTKVNETVSLLCRLVPLTTSPRQGESLLFYFFCCRFFLQNHSRGSP